MPMPSGGHPGATLAPPAPTTTASSAEAVQSKRDLTSWWKNFKRATPQRVQEEKRKYPRRRALLSRTVCAERPVVAAFTC
jgi:hypothetical protein